MSVVQLWFAMKFVATVCVACATGVAPAQHSRSFSPRSEPEPQALRGFTHPGRGRGRPTCSPVAVALPPENVVPARVGSAIQGSSSARESHSRHAGPTARSNLLARRECRTRYGHARARTAGCCRIALCEGRRDPHDGIAVGGRRVRGHAACSRNRGRSRREGRPARSACSAKNQAGDMPSGCPRSTETPFLCTQIQHFVEPRRSRTRPRWSRSGPMRRCRRSTRSTPASRMSATSLSRRLCGATARGSSHRRRRSLFTAGQAFVEVMTLHRIDRDEVSAGL